MGSYQAQALKTIAVYGYYNNGNIGDESFKECFRYLWPMVHFDFLNEIPPNINSYDAIWFGGGDLFDQPIKNVSKIQIPIGLIGVGYNSIHPSNKFLFDESKVIITRNDSPYLVADDLCFCLPELIIQDPPSKVVTIFLNDFLSSRKNSPEWINLSNQWFNSEFSDVCDGLHKRGYTLNFVPMCTNDFIDDRRAAASVITKMVKRNGANWILKPMVRSADLIEVISNSSFVVSQRLHGSIFSYLCNVPQISINHHDKMKHFCNKVGLPSINYYGFNKELFFDQFEKSSHNVSRVGYLNKARQRWQDLSHIVAQEFSL